MDKLLGEVRSHMDKPELSAALSKIFGVIDLSNKYIDANKPWELYKTEQKDRLNAVLYNLTEGIRVVGTLLLPFMTKYPRRMFDGLGLPVPTDLKSCKFGAIESYATTEIEPILNRLDIKKELKELEELAEKMNETKEVKSEAKAEEPAPEQISIDDFFKTQILVGLIEAAEKIEKSKKLLKLTVFDGTRRRTVVSGIANAYSPEDVVGKKVALVANLKPAKLCGVTSEGMLLCSVGEDGIPKLVTPLGEAGDKIC